MLKFAGSTALYISATSLTLKLPSDLLLRFHLEFKPRQKVGDTNQFRRNWSEQK